MLGNIKIPSPENPSEGLQLMGLQETRMLDFKNLIILSANEGILPQNTSPSSFIPYNLRVGFRLPTPENADALYAYYFIASCKGQTISKSSIPQEQKAF